MSLRTPVGRVHYDHLFEPFAFEGEDKAFYRVTLSFDSDTDLSVLKAAEEAAVAERWPKGKPPKYHSPFIDGDTLDDQHMAGKIVLRLKSRSKPQAVDRNLEPIDPEDLDGVYPGCFGRASVTMFAYDTSGNVGCSFWLSNFQKIRDGERIGGRTTADEDFDVVADEPADAASDLI